MSYEQRRIHWPILGAATAIALAVTLGLAAAMNAAATPEAYLPTLASAGTPTAAYVVDEPIHIDVVATREHPAVHGFSFASHKRAG